MRLQRCQAFSTPERQASASFKSGLLSLGVSQVRGGGLKRKAGNWGSRISFVASLQPVQNAILDWSPET